MQEPSQKDELRVGVIIPCFNHGRYITKALNSVVKQKYDNLCIYVSNEGSTDNSLELINNLITDKNQIDGNTIFGKYQNIPLILFNNPNPSGPSSARNNLIRMAWNNDAFCMLDADDYYLPGKIKKSVYIMSSDIDRIGIVYSDAIIYNEVKDIKIHEYREPFSISRLRQECIISNTPLINKIAIEKCGFYDKTMRTAEDWDLWLRICKKFVAVHIAEPLHVYRVTGFNSSDTVPSEIWRENWSKIQNRIQNGSY